MMEQKPWLEQYPKGVAHEIDTEKYSSLIHLFEESVQAHPTKLAYIYMDRSYTFAELDTLSHRFAAYLQYIGLKSGDKLAVQMPNCIQYPVVLFGAIRAGVVVVNTNPLYTPREMKHQFVDSGAKAIVILANFVYHLETILAETLIKHVIITELGDLLDFPKKHLVNFVVKHVKKMVPSYHIRGAVSFGQALNIGKTLPYHRPEVKNTDLAFIQYTGGTTGVSKGAALSHKNLIANIESVSEWFKPMISQVPDLKILGALPFYHIFALTVNVLTGMKLAFTNVVIVNPRDQKALCKDLRKHDIAIFPGLNTLFNALLHNNEFRFLDFSALKITIAGGMALQKSVAEGWEALTNCRISEGYGLSETSPVLSCNPCASGTQQIGTIGLPFPSTVMKILKEDGSWGTVGDIGEICAAGPQVMEGYYKQPEETAKVFIIDDEGRRFFKTGDIGLMQEDGFFRIVDRKKDMILVSGFNVYPNEVEDVLSMHPDILEVACVGVNDEHSTEVVKVFIVKRNDSLTEEAVQDFAKEYLTGYKCPKYVEFRKELPKSNVGKILRRELKDKKSES